MRALVLAAALLLSGAAPAAERVHTIAAGESAGSVARKYYGDKTLADLLLRYNGKAGKMIHPGEKLTIPVCETYRAKAGDTWSALAKKFLGRAGAAPAIAELNGYAAGKPLRVGARIVIPVILRHTLARGESLAILAQRFYGDPNKAALLQEFGRIEDAKRVAVGTALEIPLVAFVALDKPPDVIEVKKEPEAVPPTPVEKPAEVEAVAVPAPSPPIEVRRFEGPINTAGLRFIDGEYERTKEILEGLRERVATEGTELDRREWGLLLAFTYVALDRDDDACAVYRSTPRSGPALDPDLVSPRIRSVLSQCERLDNPAVPPQIPPHAGTRG